MFDVVLYNSFSKPYNSTKTPSGGDTFPCSAVEPCSMVNPTISFNQGTGWNPASYNYAYVEVWGRYYWVNEWTWDSGRWYATLKSDALASFKSELLSLTEYVTRAEAEYDGTIMDSMYPVKTNFTFTDSGFRPFQAYDMSNGVYVLGVANGGPSSKGGITYYCGTQEEMSSLFEFMYKTTDWIGGIQIDDISNDLLKCLVNPAQYLTSLMWFPVDKSTIARGNGGMVNAGWWTTEINLQFSKNEFVIDGSFIITEHPQANRGSYLNHAPYTEIKIYVPPFGSLTVDTHKYGIGTTISMKISVDTVTGQGTLYIFPKGSETGSGSQLSAQIGVPVALTAMTSDVVGAASTVVSQTLGGISNGSHGGLLGGLLGGIAGAANGIVDAAQQITPDVSVIGSNGNSSLYQYNGCIYVIRKLLVEEDIHHYGRPLCKKKALSSLSGYTQIAHFDGNLSCTQPEQQEIKGLVEEGFYIE